MPTNTKPSQPSDKEMLDWLDKNIFHREITDDWDKRMRAGQSMWVTFAPHGHQGSARNIIAAAMAEQEAATVRIDKPAGAAPVATKPAEEDRYCQCMDCGSWKKMIPGNHHPWCGCGSDRFNWGHELPYDPEASSRTKGAA